MVCSMALFLLHNPHRVGFLVNHFLSTMASNLIQLKTLFLEINVVLSTHINNYRFSVTNILSSPHNDWTGPRGRISKPLVEQSMATEGEQSLFCACGPTPFTEEAQRLDN